MAQDHLPNEGKLDLSIKDLGPFIAAKRGARGIRETANEAGVSPATLSRVENGHMPDLNTFAKICRWLDRDPREFLGGYVAEDQTPKAVVHFRKKKSVSPETAVALGELILAAQRAARARSTLLDG